MICGRAGISGHHGVPDWPAIDLGPLGGICGALRYAHDHRFDAVLSIACDMPMLPPDLVAKMTAGKGACFVRHAPVVGQWPVELFEALQHHLSGFSDRSVAHWATAMKARPIDFDFRLPNFNFVADLQSYGDLPAD